MGEGIGTIDGFATEVILLAKNTYARTHDAPPGAPDQRTPDSPHLYGLEVGTGQRGERL